jgi:1-deoxy-D-xylulose-5-phosphate synthase
MSSLLDTINSPQDLKSIPKYQLYQLAKEIRQRIIATVAQTGGHLASNLGVVELTIALHYVFNTPQDKIIWDVGHQSYTHKLLTGRGERFSTLRQWKGISGFPKRDESPHDAFGTGHASTSISAALGMVEGIRHKQERHFTIAVIGDGSLTGGMAFEALNHAGTLKRNLIVILNDNEMSISPNVGALSRYLNRIITGQFYHKLKKELEHLLKGIPNVGDQMMEAAYRVKEALKTLVVPVTMFDELGFEYFGPIRGHSLDDLLETFDAVKKLEGPILIHIMTKKGKGYPPAEERSHLFHSAAPFDIKTGRFKKKSAVPSYTHFFSQTMIKLARRNEKIIAITAAMSEGTGLNKFADAFPDRFYDVGIAEQHAVTFAAGLATEGLRPVVAIYSTFLQRAYDQILHDVCLQRLPVTFALDRAGIVGEDGPTHNGVFDLTYLRSIPQMIVMAPKDENELQHMLYTAIATPAPVSIRYPRGSAVGVKLDQRFKLLKIGLAEVLKQGKDIAILAIGNMVYPAQDAAAELKRSGIEAAVVNARFVKPLDKKLISRLAKEIGCLLTVEENNLQGGFGSAVLELLEEQGLTGVKFHRLGIPDEFLEHGSPQLLRRKYRLDASGIAKAAKKLLERNLRRFQT